MSHDGFQALIKQFLQIERGTEGLADFIEQGQFGNALCQLGVGELQIGASMLTPIVLIFCKIALFLQSSIPLF